MNLSWSIWTPWSTTARPTWPFSPPWPPDRTASPPTGEEEDYGLIILKTVLVNGEEQLSTLDSDEELEAVYQQFMESLFADEDEGD